MTGDDWNRSAETLHRCDRFVARRVGTLPAGRAARSPHRVLSTSAECGGEREDVALLANHQSCEATGDAERYKPHRRSSGSRGITARSAPKWAFAAGPDGGAWAPRPTWRTPSTGRPGSRICRVDAFVTAGVAGNAARAGDPARWLEASRTGSWQRVASRRMKPQSDPEEGAAAPHGRHDQHHPAAELPADARGPGARRHDA